MGKGDPCEICGGTESNLVDGFYYCAECGTQDTNVRETVVEHTVLTDGTFGFARTQKIYKKLKDGVKMSPEWYKWHTYNFILAGLTEQLVRLGAAPSLKMKVLWIWTRYIKKYQKKDKMGRTQMFSQLEASSGSEESAEDSRAACDGPEPGPGAGSRSWPGPLHRLSRPVLAALLALALNHSRSALQPSLLLRLVLHRLLALNDLPALVPAGISPADVPGFYGSLRKPITSCSGALPHVMGRLSRALALGAPLTPALEPLLADLLRELRLPPAFARVVLALVDRAPIPFLNERYRRTFKTSAHDRHPDYEAVVMAYVLVALKMCFGLDDALERRLSAAADRVNAEEGRPRARGPAPGGPAPGGPAPGGPAPGGPAPGGPAPGGPAPGGPAPGGPARLFSPREWLEHLRFRRVTLAAHYAPLAWERNMRADGYVFFDHFEDHAYGGRVKTSEADAIGDRLAMDIIDKIPFGGAPDVVPAEELRPCLAARAPLATLAEVVARRARDPAARRRLDEDFTRYDVEYAFRTLALPGAGRDLFRGVARAGKTEAEEPDRDYDAPLADTTMVHVRNCENKNWFKTRRPMATHVVRAEADGAGPESDPADGAGPESDPADGAGPESDPADGAGPKSDPADGAGPESDPADGAGPESDPADGAGPESDPADGAGPESDPADGAGPESDPADGAGPKSDPADGAGPESDPADGAGPESDPADGAGPESDPADGAGPESDPADGAGPESDPADGAGPKSDPADGAGPESDPADGDGAPAEPDESDDEDVELETFEEEIEGENIFDDDFWDVRVKEEMKIECDPESFHEIKDDARSHVDDFGYFDSFHENVDRDRHEDGDDDGDDDGDGDRRAGLPFDSDDEGPRYDPATFNRHETIKRIMTEAYRELKVYDVPVRFQSDADKPRAKHARKRPTPQEQVAARRPRDPAGAARVRRAREANRDAARELMAAYYDHLNKDVLHQVARQIRPFIDDAEARMESNDTAPRRDSAGADAGGGDASVVDVGSNDTRDVEVVEDNLNETDDDDAAAGPAEDPLYEGDVKFDKKAHDARQLYVRLRAPPAAEPASSDDSDPEAEKLLREKMANPVPHRKSTTRKKEKIDLKNIDHLVEDPESITVFNYWFTHFTSKIRGYEADSCAVQASLDEVLPRSFRHVLREAAAQLRLFPTTLYAYLTDIETEIFNTIGSKLLRNRQKLAENNEDHEHCKSNQNKGKNRTRKKTEHSMENPSDVVDAEEGRPPSKGKKKTKRKAEHAKEIVSSTINDEGIPPAKRKRKKRAPKKSEKIIEAEKLDKEIGDVDDDVASAIVFF